VIETSDISINSPGASRVAAHGHHPIGGHLEEAHCGESRDRRTELHDAFVSLACRLICRRRLKKARS
jgi:hypothetical protein